MRLSEDVPSEGRLPEGPPEGAKRRPPAARRTSSAGLLGPGRPPGHERAQGGAGAMTPARPPGPRAATGAPRGRPPSPRPARAAPGGTRAQVRPPRPLGARRLPALCRRRPVLHAPPPGRAGPGRAARRYEYVKRLHCPPRPRPRRGPAGARAGEKAAAEAGPGSRRSGPQPPVPRAPLRPAAPSLSPPPLGSRRGLGAPRPPSSPPLIIIILSTNKLC